MQKRINSMLVPYRFDNDELFVFLQRRSDDAPRNPSMLGAFGGGLEGNESSEQALFREMEEELRYKPVKHVVLGEFETDHSVSSYYIEEVPLGFEKNITIHEGKGGEWHPARTLVNRDDVSPNTKRVVAFMSEKLNNHGKS